MEVAPKLLDRCNNYMTAVFLFDLGSSSFVDTVKGKVRGTLDHQPKKFSAHTHSATMPATTIISRQHTSDISSDPALSRRGSIPERRGSKDGEHSSSEMISFVVGKYRLMSLQRYVNPISSLMMTL